MKASRSSDAVSDREKKKVFTEIARARKARLRDLVVRLKMESSQIKSILEELKAEGLIAERSYPVPSLDRFYVTSKGLSRRRRRGKRRARR